MSERNVIQLDARVAEFERNFSAAIEEHFKPALRKALADVFEEFDAKLTADLSEDWFALKTASE